jgi:hypothetical protein
MAAGVRGSVRDFVTVIQVERREAGRHLLGVLVRHLQRGAVYIPIGLTPTDIATEHLLERTIRSLLLAIGLQVIRRAHCEVRSQLIPQSTPEVRGCNSVQRL